MGENRSSRKTQLHLHPILHCRIKKEKPFVPENLKYIYSIDLSKKEKKEKKVYCSEEENLRPMHPMKNLPSATVIYLWYVFRISNLSLHLLNNCPAKLQPNASIRVPNPIVPDPPVVAPKPIVDLLSNVKGRNRMS